MSFFVDLAKLVSFAAVFRLVTQGALRDEPKNGCEGDYGKVGYCVFHRDHVVTAGSNRDRDGSGNVKKDLISRVLNFATIHEPYFAIFRNF